MHPQEEKVLSAILGRLNPGRSIWEPFPRAREQSKARLAEMRAERRAARLLGGNDRRA